jgi:hypothetical protein
MDAVLPVCLAPWIENPYRLVTWLEMLIFSARAFVWCGRRLAEIRDDCHMGAATVLNQNVVIAMAQDIDDKARDKVLASIASIEEQFRSIGLAITADTVKELENDIKSGTRQSFQWLIDQIKSIEKLVDKELKEKLFLYVPPERAKFWPTFAEPHAFGSFVTGKFPSSTFEANSAAFCLATSQSTAAVFHLMRILEIGLAAIGTVFGVSLAHTNWAPAIEQIESKVRDIHKDPQWKKLSDYKEQQEFYAKATSYLAITKDAWRNHTMHVRGKYTQDEAELIFENVKAFMQKLATRLHE